nr:sulfotransferase [Rhodothalassium salexigens]
MIFGSPRSGTTWLGKILDAHPDVHYVHEPEIGRGCGLPQFPAADDADHRRIAERDLALWTATRDLRSLGTRPVMRKRGENAVAFGLRVAEIYAGKALERLSYPASQRLPILRGTARHPRVRVIKTVNMLGRAPTLAAVAPSLRGIHLLRHPCGHIASVLRGMARYGERDALANSALVNSPLGRRMGLTPVDLKDFSAEESLAWKWAAFNEVAWDALPPDEGHLRLRYEQVVADPPSAARAICAQLGLDWTAEIDRFIAQSRSDGAPSSPAQPSHYSLKRAPETATNRWRDELSDDQVRTIANICCKTAAGRWFFDALPDTARTVPIPDPLPALPGDRPRSPGQDVSALDGKDLLP